MSDIQPHGDTTDLRQEHHLEAGLKCRFSQDIPSGPVAKTPMLPMQGDPVQSLLRELDSEQ